MLLLILEIGHPYRHRLDQDVALERSPHLLYITLLENPLILFHSSTLQDRKDRKEREREKCGIGQKVCSSFYTRHLCHVEPRSAGLWLTLSSTSVHKC